MFESVLVGTDGSEAAGSSAETAGVERVETFARVGETADAVLDVAEEQGADLVMVGNKAMTGATRFLLGSVPNKVSHHAPVLGRDRAGGIAARCRSAGPVVDGASEWGTGERQRRH